jgi:hypothetical protein
MKYLIALVLCIFAPTALANSVTICKDDQLLISSDSVQIISKDHETVKLSLDCDLNISPDSKVVVKNHGRRIVEDRSIVIEVDDKRSRCEVQQIV